MTIGGTEYKVPPIMTFEMMERCWPSITAASEFAYGVQETAAHLVVIANLLLPTQLDINALVLKKSLRVGLVDERIALAAAVGKIQLASGLVRDKSVGEAEGTAVPAP